MRLHRFQQWLDHHIHALESACADADTTQLKALSGLANHHVNTTLKTLASAVETVKVDESRGADCRQLSDTINAMVDTTRDIGKADAVRALDTFAKALSKRKDENFSELVATLEQHLAAAARKSSRRTSAPSLTEQEIEARVHELVAVLGDEAKFDQVFQRLENDNSVKAQDAKNIAKKFVGKAGSSKSEAFRLIHERHSTLLESRARAKSTGGRSAA